jgi:hypothetical protein
MKAIEYSSEDIETVNKIRRSFLLDIEAITPRQPSHLHHPALNHRFGIELEFLNSSSRFALANRVNSCMFKQNGRWWRKNFNALDPINPDLPSGRPITSSNDEFDEWSGFFMEATLNYHAPSHKGIARCDRQGNAGIRIETDVSVTLDSRLKGITLWSKTAQGADTDLSSGGIPNNRATAFVRDDISIKPYTPSPFCAHYTRTSDVEWTSALGTDHTLNLWDNNEMVTNVLTNEHVKYPNRRLEGGVVGEGLLPLGGLAIDNICNHMLSHANVVGTQDMGFHLHISEHPKIENINTRKEVLTGFVKLFYLFEPMLYAFNPIYRSRSAYCQSIQSIFTLDEILAADSANELVWKDLVADSFVQNNITYEYHAGGVNRKLKGQRYLSLNLTNCKPKGIGTVEIRLGHSTFDSTYIQAYIHVLLALYSLNTIMCERGNREHNDVYYYHNFLLTNGPIPEHCNQTTEAYNTSRISEDSIDGAPVLGFIESIHYRNGGDNELTSRLTRMCIYQCLLLFRGLTGSSSSLEYLLPYLNEYYAPQDTLTWLNIGNIIDPITIDELEQSAAEYFGEPSLLTQFTPVNEKVYAINADGKYSLIHKCKTCSQNSAGKCSHDYNEGNMPERSVYPRPPSGSRIEKTVFTLKCNNRPVYVKTQSELLTNKRTAGVFAGGKKRFTRRRRYGGRVQIMASSIPETVQKPPVVETKQLASPAKVQHNFNFTEYFKQFRNIRRGAQRVEIQEIKGKLVIGYVNWLGEFSPESRLTMIVNTLLERKIIDKATLELLVANGYIDYYIFTLSNEEHVGQLTKELEALKISPDTVEKIRNVYTEFNTKPSTTAPTATTTEKTGSSRMLSPRERRKTLRKKKPYTIQSSRN